MASKMASILVCLLLIVTASKGRMMEDYRNMERTPYRSIEDEIRDYLGDNERSREVKRQTPSGSCTCTCETKPVYSGRKNFPETAALMRTAIKPDMASGKTKDPVSTRFHHADMISHRSDGDERSSKIVKVDPWDYSHMLNAGYHSDGSHDNEEKEEIEKETSAADDADEAESNENWGHESRFPWKNLPDKICYRHKCSSTKDCCKRYNVCDKSAKVCIDCWHGSNCNSELDCCQRFPYCQSSRNAVSGSNGKCVDVLKKTKEE